MPSVQITEDNPALETLQRSWVTTVYSDEDGIGSMGSLHEAGDALVALAFLDEVGPIVLGSGVMIGPGLVLAATHVLEEFVAQNEAPVLLTFLPDAARAWLPREQASVSGPSMFGTDRRIVSDISLLSCTLNSEAHSHHPLTLAPMQIALPLVGERLWAFGYRHGAVQDSAALVTPLVTSGVVTAVFPHGRGERMPASCVEVAMDTKGGMSGGPVVNTNGDLVGIVSSSIDGGPSYVTLIWDALRLKTSSRLPSLADWGDINLFTAREMGLVKLHGNIKRSKRGDVTFRLSGTESELMAAAAPTTIVPQSGRMFTAEQLDTFEEDWLSELEATASDVAMAYLENLELPKMRSFLATSDVPVACLRSIQGFTVEDMEGLEDPDIQSIREDEDGIAAIAFAFDLLTVIWTVQVSTEDYLALSKDYDAFFFNITINEQTTNMDLIQHCHFEAALKFNQKTEQFTEAFIKFSGVLRPRPLPRLTKSSLSLSGQTSPT
ncbi:serine protease [uncultured Oxalicibacterium sp.]|uniref:S1 family peptidase n=1 Tax=uncultured Oxalicibacterium sp. TaxID=1168540 RepID=UPI0025D1C3A5|nr:serine protease [uncultured Oxalicibacterium sp.]